MGYIIDRVVICDACVEPVGHYWLLRRGKSKRVLGRRPPMQHLALAKWSIS